MMRKSGIEAHTRVGNDSSYWVRTARALFAASKTVKCERERVEATLTSGKAPDIVLTVWTQLMLTAFGIECLIKAIWIKQGNQLARDGKYIGMTKKEKPHELVRLCDIAGIALNQRETDALQQISDIAKSIGRYPIARNAEVNSRAGVWSYDDTIENFLEKLKAQYRNPSPANIIR
jgi:hypothetical protein